MHSNNFLYNINDILVQPGLEKEYIEFSKHLNHFLEKKYGKYYIGLELSMDKVIHNHFTVVGFYKNEMGSYKIQAALQQDVSRLYEETFGNKVQRSSVFSFADDKKVIPVHANLVK